jgi:hypothetical protein
LATASKSGYNNGQRSVQVTVNYTIHTGTILLVITDANDNPIDGANINSTSQPSGTSQLTGVTDAAGFVAFNDAQEGDYTLQITKAGYDTQNRDVTVTAGHPTSVTIILTGTPSLLPPTPWLIAIIAIVIIVVAIIIIVVRKYHIISFSKDQESETSPLTTQESNSEENHSTTEDTETNSSTTQDANSTKNHNTD